MNSLNNLHHSYKDRRQDMILTIAEEFNFIQIPYIFSEDTLFYYDRNKYHIWQVFRNVTNDMNIIPEFFKPNIQIYNNICIKYSLKTPEYEYQPFTLS
jgi:hypothetical protein